MSRLATGSLHRITSAIIESSTCSVRIGSSAIGIPNINKCQIRCISKFLYIPRYKPGQKDAELKRRQEKEQKRLKLYGPINTTQPDQSENGEQSQTQTAPLPGSEPSVKDMRKWSWHTRQRRSRLHEPWTLSSEQLQKLRESNLPTRLVSGRLPGPVALMQELEREYIEKLAHQYPGRQIAKFEAGDRIKITKRLSLEKQKFEEITGMCIAKTGGLLSSSFIILNSRMDIDYELQFPLHSPFIQKIEILERTKVRRAKLFYLRDREPHEYMT